ncbi:collagen type IV alpha-3-binding protein [Acrasis kona]
MWRGSAKVKGATVKQWRELLSATSVDVKLRNIFDPDNRGFKLVHEFDGDNFAIAHTKYTANSYFVSDRDFLFVRAVRTHWSDQEGICFIGTSLNEADFADDPIVKNNQPNGVVRAHIDFFGWIVKPSEEGIEIVYYNHAQPGGWIPTAVYNALSKTQALSPLKYKQYLEK